MLACEREKEGFLKNALIYISVTLYKQRISYGIIDLSNNH